MSVHEGAVLGGGPRPICCWPCGQLTRYERDSGTVGMGEGGLRGGRNVGWTEAWADRTAAWGHKAVAKLFSTWRCPSAVYAPLS